MAYGKFSLCMDSLSCCGKQIRRANNVECLDLNNVFNPKVSNKYIPLQLDETGDLKDCVLNSTWAGVHPRLTDQR